MDRNGHRPETLVKHMIWIIKSTGKEVPRGRKYSVNYRTDGTLWVLIGTKWQQTDFAVPMPTNHPPVAGDTTATIEVQP